MGISKTVMPKLKWLKRLGYLVAIVTVLVASILPASTAFAADDCNAQGECGEGTIGEQRLKIEQMYPVFIASWSTVEGADRYNVYRDSELIQSSTDTMYTDTSSPDGQYWFFFSVVYIDGHESSPVSIRVKVDHTPPTISYTMSPEPNSSGWVNAPWVRVIFNCSDANDVQCTSQKTVWGEVVNYQVVGTATDAVGNVSTVTAVINNDRTVPVINGLNWSANPVNEDGGSVLTVDATDMLSGVAGGEYFMGNTDPGSGNATPMELVNGVPTATIGSELAPGTYDVTVRVRDGVGHWSESQVTQLVVKSLDVTAPTVSGVVASPNPKNATATGTITANASDDFSGVVAGEYYIGTDPGQGSATPMTYSNGQISGTLGADLPVGVYKVYVRAKDAAGNWSAQVSTKLVVKQTGTSSIAASGAFTPSTANGDVLPALGTASFKLAQYHQNVSFGNNGITNGSNISFTYTYGSTVLCGALPFLSQCHQLTFTTSGNANITSIVFDGDNNSRATISGTGTVSVDGVTTTNPFTVTAVSAARAGSGTNSYNLSIYASDSSIVPENLLYTATNTGTVIIL